MLLAWRRGEQQARDRLVAVLQSELHAIAERHLRSERTDHTLQATALVNEAYLRLIDVEVTWQDRTHFFAVAARIMRRILVDYARGRGRKKRGGDLIRVELNENVAATKGHPPDMLALDEALDELEAVDERKAKVIELHYFGGLKYGEVAEALGVSKAAVDRDLRFAKAWLYDRLR